MCEKVGLGATLIRKLTTNQTTILFPVFAVLITPPFRARHLTRILQRFDAEVVKEGSISQSLKRLCDANQDVSGGACGSRDFTTIIRERLTGGNCCLGK